jgi:uncharacterized protein
MSELFTTRASSHAVASPCVAICTMNPASDFCDGCQRTIGEIAAWSTMSNDEKRQVWVRIGQRKARAAEQAMALTAQPLQNPKAGL